MNYKIVTTLALIALSVSLARANDETVIHDSKVAHQREVIKAAEAKQQADNDAAVKAALKKSDTDARDTKLDALSKSIPSGSGSKGNARAK